MTFKDALKILNIEDYEESIMSSNSKGELSHLADYIVIAEMCRDSGGSNGFRQIFEQIVSDARGTWSRPQSVYQHILRIFQQSFLKHT